MFTEDPDPREERSTHGLLERMRSGDRAAAEELFRLHRARLERALLLRLGRKAGVEIEDLVQETFRKALRDLEHFEWRGQGAFLAWLLQIAVRTFQDQARSRAAAPRTAPVDSGSRLDELGQDTGTPSAAAARSEELVWLQEALERLSDDERDAIVRRKILGQDYPSLASDLGVSEGAARMRVSRALVEMTRHARAGS